MAAVTICSDFGAQKNYLSLFPSGLSVTQREVTLLTVVPAAPNLVPDT